jgi:hypothetical protein
VNSQPAHQLLPHTVIDASLDLMPSTIIIISTSPGLPIVSRDEAVLQHLLQTAFLPPAPLTPAFLGQPCRLDALLALPPAFMPGYGVSYFSHLFSLGVQLDSI